MSLLQTAKNAQGLKVSRTHLIKVSGGLYKMKTAGGINGRFGVLKETVSTPPSRALRRHQTRSTASPQFRLDKLSVDVVKALIVMKITLGLSTASRIVLTKE